MFNCLKIKYDNLMYSDLCNSRYLIFLVIKYLFFKIVSMSNVVKHGLNCECSKIYYYDSGDYYHSEYCNSLKHMKTEKIDYICEKYAKDIIEQK